LQDGHFVSAGNATRRLAGELRLMLLLDRECFFFGTGGIGQFYPNQHKL
jgi:hypothetical protein